MSTSCRARPSAGGAAAFCVGACSSLRVGGGGAFAGPVCGTRLRRPRCAPVAGGAAHVRVRVALAAALPDTPVEPGVLLEYVAASGARRLGHALRPDGKRNWIVEDQHGAAQSVAPKQISFVYGPLAAFPGNVTPAEAIASAELDCEKLVAETKELLDIAWEIVICRDEDDGGSTATLREVAELVFDDSSSASMYAAHVLLEEDRIFFKKKMIKGNALYEAKSESRVTEARAALRAVERREKEERELREAVVASVQDRDPGRLRVHVGEDYFSLFVSSLEAIAEDFGSNMRDSGYEESADSGFTSLDADGKAAAKLVLGALDLPVVPQSAFDVLVAWKIFVPHENLAFRKAGLHRTMEFSPRLLEVATLLNEADLATIEDVDANHRRDLTDMVCYAIDSADTDEIDDAISWDAANGLAWVHVADPTRYFPKGLDDPVVVEALRRATTLYLPTGKHTMFPKTLARERLSLGGVTSDRCALSFGFRVQDNGALDTEHTVVTASRVQNPVRLTYEKADEILSGDDTSHDLHLLYEVASKRMAFREEDGALIVPSPFSRVKVTNPESEEPGIDVSVLESDTKAWNLVSEFMIAACGIAGEYGAQAALPLPYRGQEPFDVPSEEALDDIPKGPARNAAYWKNATPSEIRPEPVVHASLALDAYVQVTSPIRRGVDLLAHLQVKSALRGESPLLDMDRMKSEISRHAEATRVTRAVDQATSKYWHLEYLRRKGPGTAHEAIYVRPLREGDDRLGLVYMVESGFQLVSNVPGDSRPGMQLFVKVSTAEPRSLFSRSEATLVRSRDEAAKETVDDVSDLFSVIDSEDDDP